MEDGDGVGVVDPAELVLVAQRGAVQLVLQVRCLVRRGEVVDLRGGNKNWYFCCHIESSYHQVTWIKLRHFILI